MAENFHGVQFFLGANSAQGFSSLYDQWVDQSQLQAFYVIKGGAGCGKSTLMHRIAQWSEQVGDAVEYIRCSGDPDSLDGVYLPAKGVALVDGTSPHRIDPEYPGAVGHYVNLGMGYDHKALFSIRAEIVEATQAYRNCYPEASRCIKGAVDSYHRGCAPLQTAETLEEMKQLAKEILAKELKTTCPVPGKRVWRFLGGPTCQGRILLEGTVAALCERGYEIRDGCGLAGGLIEFLANAFQAGGYDVIVCPCPENPDQLEHLLIPERSLAFVTGPMRSTLDVQKIDTQSFVENSVWQESKHFLDQCTRMAEEQMTEGMEHLAKAKRRHDLLEELYHPHMDFSYCEEQIERLWKEIQEL